MSQILIHFNILQSAGFSNLKKVAGGNCKVAGALSHCNDSSLVEWGSTPAPSAERNEELPPENFRVP